MTPLPFRPDGEVLSLRATGDGLDYALRRNQVTSVEHISISSGSVSLMSSQGSTGPVALLDNGTLITSANGTKLVRGDGSEVAFPVTAIQSLSWLGEQFLQATTAEANWVIRVAVGSEQAFLLPGVAPPVERAPARPERPRRPAQLSRGGVSQ